MGDQSRQHVVGILPDRFGDDQRRLADPIPANTCIPSFCEEMKPCFSFSL